MFRRVLLAVLLAASMTLSGVSGCSTGPCASAGDPCKSSDDCCDPTTSVAVAWGTPDIGGQDRVCARLPTKW